MSRAFVLDSYAILALLDDEEGSEQVAEVIASEDAKIHLSIINLGEVYYMVSMRHGEKNAETVIGKVWDTPKIKVEGVTWKRVKDAARFKSAGGLSYADCYGAALAQELEATLLTGDPEFKRLEANGLKVLWLTQ